MLQTLRTANEPHYVYALGSHSTRLTVKTEMHTLSSDALLINADAASVLPLRACIALLMSPEKKNN